jgi:hypothetical protein
MSTGRFAALLGVLLVVGLANVAQGATGDPLILGQTNAATSASGNSTTTLTTELDTHQLNTQDLEVAHLDAFGAYVSGVLELRASSLVTIKQGTTTRTVPLDTPGLNSTAVFCTVQTPNSGALLESARINSADPTKVTVRMSAAVNRDTTVACMRTLVP